MSVLTQQTDLFRVFRAFRGLTAVFRINQTLNINITPAPSVSFFYTIDILIIKYLQYSHQAIVN
jgi:hypothetical protein